MIIEKASNSTISQAIQIIKQGGVVICPSDTNYVLITHLHSPKGVERIFKMKKRDRNKPLTLLLGSLTEILLFAHTTPQADILIKNFSLNLVTSILWCMPTVPEYITSGFPTVALTLFKNETLRRIINGVNMPVAGTSANLSGTGIVPNVEKAASQLGKYVDLIIDGGRSNINNSNTIIDFTFPRPYLVRNGALPAEKIVPFLPGLDMDSNAYKEQLAGRINSEWDMAYE